MTITYYPFDAGAGSSVTEAQWMKMMRGLINTGVFRTGRSNVDLNLFEVFGDSSGMQVKVKSGAAFIEGFFVESDAQEVLTIATADATNPRKDLVVLKLDRTANTITLTKLTGTPAVSPTTPTPTQNDTTWELPLAVVTVDALAATIAAGKVADARAFTWDRIYKAQAINVTSQVQTLTDGATINWNMDNGPIAHVTLGGNRTLAAPTNLRAGATYVLRVNRSGAYTISTWNAIFKWPNGTAPVQTNVNAAIDVFSFYCPDGTILEGNMLKDLK